MRIGVDFHTWGGIYQGSRSHILGIYREAIVSAPDIEFIFFVTDATGLQSAFPEFRYPNVKVVDMGSSRGLTRLLYRLPLLALKFQCDLLHTQYRTPLLRGTRCAVTIHDVLVETHPQFFSKMFVAFSRITFKWSARRAAVCLTVSKYSRDKICEIYKLPSNKVVVTPNAVDVSRFAHEKAESDQSALEIHRLESGNYWLTVGRLEPRKNHVQLIKAWMSLDDRSKKLVIVGQRDFRFGEVFEFVHEQKLENSVIFLESVDDNLLPVLYRNCYCFVYPAFAEGFGMPVLEAMACGAPVITSNTTSLPEVCGPNGARYVNPNNVEDIASAMKLLSQDLNERARLISNGLERSVIYSWKESAMNMISAFRSLKLVKNN